MKPTKKTSPDKLWRAALIGGLTLGFLGFASGSAICLYYKLPIPPLFLTELGMIVGGCLGALCAATNTEGRVLPSLAAFALSLLVCLVASLSLALSLTSSLIVGAAAWCLVSQDESKERGWRRV